MKWFEDFLLNHPELIQPQTFRYPITLGYAVVVFGTLWLAFGGGNLNKDVPWSSLHGKLFRVCWIVGSMFFIAVAYDQWHYPESKDFNYPVVQYGLGLSWFILFCAAMFSGISKMRRDKQAVKSDN